VALTIAIAGGDTGTPLNIAKRLRIISEHIPSGSRVLDAGCGSGEYVRALSGYDVRGVENSARKVAVAADARIQRGDIESLPFDAASFDAVLLNEVLEHVPNEVRALREAARVLRPDGRLLLFSPNRLYPFETHGVDRSDGSRVAPIRTFGLPYLPLPITLRFVRLWARNYWPWQLRSLVASTGFRVLHQGYVWQTFENISGSRPNVIGLLAPALRALGAFSEHIPLIRTVGASQFIVAQPDSNR
jgi:SAM-dependent methyltransferase